MLCVLFLILKNRLKILVLCAKSLQSCQTLCDPMNYSPPGSPVHGILQVRILEWVTLSFSRETSRFSHMERLGFGHISPINPTQIISILRIQYTIVAYNSGCWG